jgi:hypothetical protein
MLFSILQAEETLQEVEEASLLEDINQEVHQVVEDRQAEEDIPLTIQGNKHNLCHHRLQVAL